MKVKAMLLCTAVLAAGAISLTGCSGSGTASSSDTGSAQMSQTVSEAVSAPVQEETASTVVFNENRGEVVDGVFTAADGMYRVTVPQDVILVSATDTTAVFTADEGKTVVTVSSETNSGAYRALTQESLESIYSQLYTDYTTTGFEESRINEQRTDYRLSFTGSNGETPMQVSIYKAITEQKAVTIQVSAEPENDHVSALLDTMAKTLVL